MIALFEGAAPDTAAGCRIEAIRRCYGDVENAAAFYKSDGGAVICRFGDRLLAAGRCDLEELCRFAGALGVSAVELEAGGGPLLPPGGWAAERRPLLYRDCGGGESIPFLASPRECFETICAADGDFASGAQYLYWLSDLTRRQNRGCAKAYHIGGAAAVLSAVGERSAYLSSVASPPDKRRSGRASRLIEAVCSDRMLCGKRLFVAAQHDGLAGFYQKNGFSRLEKSFITLKRSSF